MFQQTVYDPFLQVYVYDPECLPCLIKNTMGRDYIKRWGESVEVRK